MKFAALIGIFIFLAILFTFRPTQESALVSIEPPDGALPVLVDRQILANSQIELIKEHPQLKPSDRWVLVNFWAHWCWPCQQELPDLNRWVTQGPSLEFDILLVNSDPEGSEAFEMARTYLSQQKIGLPHFFDSDQKFKNLFQATQLPGHFLLSPDRKTLLRLKPQAVHWSDPETIAKLRSLILAY